jgi:glycosyltransferase involved in cell wall biosynthesis
VGSITIITATWFCKAFEGQRRMECAINSLRTWAKRLMYDRRLAIHVADDGSDDDLLQTFVREVRNIFSLHTFSRQERQGIGASLNKGFGVAFQEGLGLYIQDDLALEAPIDLTFPARLLEQEDVGAVRVGIPHPDITGAVRYFPGLHDRDCWAMVVDPHHYVASFRPFMAHPRFGKYLPFMVGESAEQTERDFNERYCREPSLKVLQWIPCPWKHQHVVNLGVVEPKGGA